MEETKIGNEKKKEKIEFETTTQRNLPKMDQSLEKKNLNKKQKNVSRSKSSNKKKIIILVIIFIVVVGVVIGFIFLSRWITNRWKKQAIQKKTLELERLMQQIDENEVERMKQEFSIPLILFDSSKEQRSEESLIQKTFEEKKEVDQKITNLPKNIRQYPYSEAKMNKNISLNGLVSSVKKTEEIRQTAEISKLPKPVNVLNEIQKTKKNDQVTAESILKIKDQTISQAQEIQQSVTLLKTNNPLSIQKNIDNSSTQNNNEIDPSSKTEELKKIDQDSKKTTKLQSILLSSQNSSFTKLQDEYEKQMVFEKLHIHSILPQNKIEEIKQNHNTTVHELIHNIGTAFQTLNESQIPPQTSLSKSHFDSNDTVPSTIELVPLQNVLFTENIVHPSQVHLTNQSIHPSIPEISINNIPVPANITGNMNVFLNTIFYPDIINQSTESNHSESRFEEIESNSEQEGKEQKDRSDTEKIEEKHYHTEDLSSHQATNSNNTNSIVQSFENTQ